MTGIQIQINPDTAGPVFIYSRSDEAFSSGCAHISWCLVVYVLCVQMVMGIWRRAMEENSEASDPDPAANPGARSSFSSAGAIILLIYDLFSCKLDCGLPNMELYMAGRGMQAPQLPGT